MENYKMTPPINDESQETKLVSLAMKQAQERLENGTASSQMVTHFLRLGSIKAQVELEQLKLQNQLLEAKIKSEESGQEINRMVGEVLRALKSYSGQSFGEDDGDIY